jgi:hypothetical protein
MGKVNKTYSIPIRWESYKRIEVEAEDLQSAICLALKQFLSEPDDYYLDDSTEVDSFVKEEYPNETYNIDEVWEKLY